MEIYLKTEPPQGKMEIPITRGGSTRAVQRLLRWHRDEPSGGEVHRHRRAADHGRGSDTTAASSAGAVPQPGGRAEYQDARGRQAWLRLPTSADRSDAHLPPRYGAGGAVSSRGAAVLRSQRSEPIRRDRLRVDGRSLRGDGGGAALALLAGAPVCVWKCVAIRNVLDS